MSNRGRAGLNGYEVVMDKERVNIDLLLQNEPSLPEAKRQLNLCQAFVGLLDGKDVAVALLTKRKGYFDIVNLGVNPSYQDTPAEYELLLFMLDYIRVHGERFLEIGVPSVDFRRHALLIRLGFRVVGVWANHCNGEVHTLEDGSQITNRDMLRYRIDLQELTV